jgi:hypothetical protein
MSEGRLQLFVVECRGSEGVTTFFVPTQSPDEAILQAIKTVRKARAVEPDVNDPFQEAGLEVRVGTYKANRSLKVVFGDWSLFSQ